MSGPEQRDRSVANLSVERLSEADRARGRRLAIGSHPAGNAFAMALSEHLPTLALLALGASESVVGGQSAIRMGANLLQLPTLRRVARIPKRKILTRGHLLALFGMLPLLAFTPLREAAEAGDPRPAWIALASLMVASAGISISSTVWFPMLRAYIDPERIGHFFALIRSGWHSSLIVFYLGAAYWLSRAPGDFAPLFGVVFALGVIRLLLIARMPEQSELTDQGIRVREAFQLIRDSPQLRRLLTTVASGHALRASVLPFALVMLRREVGFSEAQLLATTITSFAGGLASLYFWGRVIDRRGAAIVFRGTSIGLALLTLSLLMVWASHDTAFFAAMFFFFFYAGLAAGFGMADTHVLFKLTPVESPARILVAAAVSVGLVAAVVPLVVGLSLEVGLETTSDRRLVYHVFFAIAALIQAINWWPTRGFGPHPIARMGELGEQSERSSS
jgi:Na+/melibiose symporter-like transporter